MQQEQNDEIDLLTFLTTIWDGKWKIIITTIVTFIIGTFYTLYTPNLYEVSSTLSSDNRNVFIKYKSLNDILRENKFIDFDSSDNFEINGNVIVEMFIKEFTDYEEMISVLSKSDFVVNKIKNLNDFEKRKILVSFANKFKIIKETKEKDVNLKIVFKWHNIDNGISLLNKALKLTMLNVKNKLLMDVKSLASSFDEQNKRRITALKNKLDIKREIYELSTAKRKLYLTEQSKIAKELGIEKNNFDFSYTKIEKSKNLLPPKFLSPQIYTSLYYLRGSKAIDKEIQLINKRSKQDKDLMSENYVDIKQDLLLIENDNKPNELRDAASLIKNDNINNWINFNLEFAKIKNLKKSSLFIGFSIIIGLITGALWVLLANTLKKQRKT